MVIEMAIKDMIRHFRKAQRIKQTEMSKQLNVNIDTYRRWEQGKHSIKSEKLLDIARVLGVTVKDITGKE